MPTEVEARFATSERSALIELARIDRLGPALLGEPETAEEVDRYLDTAGARLASARWACRLRTRGDVTRISLKGPPDTARGGSGDDWLHRRPEIEGAADLTAAPTAWPASEARERLLELSGGEPLIEVLRLAQRRTERSVEIDGRALGTLSLDEVRVESDGRTRGTFLIVELELDEAGDALALETLAAELASRPGLVPERHTKLERALGMVDRPG